MKNQKLMKLIELHADLEGTIVLPRNAMVRGPCCIDALIEALRLVTKGTRLESETNALIETCDRHI
jgi:hypothetical protein